MLSKRIGIFIGQFLPLMFLLTDMSFAQSFTVDMGAEASLTGNMIQFFLILTVLSIAPGIIMMVTCFPFMVTVLSASVGVPQTPYDVMKQFS